MPKNVQLPDGSVVEFPDGMSDDAIGGAIKQHLASTPTPPVDMSNVAGAPSTGLPQPPTQQPANMQPSLLGRDTNPGPVANFVKGAVKSIPGTLSSIDNQVAKIPGIGNALTTPLVGNKTSEEARADLYNSAQTHGTAQAIGKGVGDAAQFLIPGGAEEKLGLYGASKLPMLGRYAAPVAKLGAQALGAGTVNAAQGGSFGGGAAAGAAGGLIGQGLQKVAPMLAETALGVRAGDRAYGRTPGSSILSETTGIKPGAIADQASKKVGLYSSQLDDAARQSPVPVNLQPAKDTAESWLKSAIERNNPSTTKEVGQIGSQLDARPSGGAIPQFVQAHEGLALRRGIDDLQTSWNPATVKDFSNRAVSATRNALGDELEPAIPGYRDLNSRISTLLPVSQRAGAADLNAGTVQRMVGRLKTHTGAMIAPLTAASIGAAEHGPIGGMVGGAAGLLGQELLASPTIQMGAARLANSPLTQKAIPGFVGAGLQAAPKRKGLFQ